MKVAIITWFDNLNYGTALQCLALQNYIKEAYNAQVDLIKYYPVAEDYLRSFEQKTEHFLYKSIVKLKYLANNESAKYNSLLNTSFEDELIKKKEHFAYFLSVLSFTESIRSKEDLSKLEDKYDLFICGSDQIWNPQNLNSNYYLNFIKCKPKIAYAASFGINYLPSYSHRYIKEYLTDFAAIGLRESTCKAQLENVTGIKDISVVCDPTLLFNSEYWSQFKSASLKNKPYFVSYFLGNTKASKAAISIAKSKLDLENLILPATSDMLTLCERENIEYGPAEFIEAINSAKFVLTDSFHAVCFSIIFKKNFCVLRKHSKKNPFNQNSRIESLLEITGLNGRLIDNSKEVNNIIDRPIDYTVVEEKLNSYIKKSKGFLDSSIKVI